ncbi:MAG: NYN domain-containing protein, partial [Armatimonadetes bacterium]|nr:NYN domain-containing protein [Armatimonadota bacterium]
MASRVRLFIDFWNFQLSWNDDLGSGKQCDWPKLPASFVAEAQKAIGNAGIVEVLQLEETRVYASYNPARSEDTKLRGWLSNFLDRQPSFRVFAAARKDKPATIRCRACGQVLGACPQCSKPLVRSREKGVDTAIVTDVLSLAWEGAFEVAILVSSDADMIPCVERVQEKGFK